jgi:Nucleotidyltransferase
MQDDDVAVFSSVLQALQDVGILADIVIVGGWAQHLYRRYFSDPPELSALRTVDIDILFRRPPGIRPTGSIEETLNAAGFEREIAGDGSTKFTSREAEVEFLIPDKGRGQATVLSLLRGEDSPAVGRDLLAYPAAVQSGRRAAAAPFWPATQPAVTVSRTLPLAERSLEA